MDSRTNGQKDHAGRFRAPEAELWPGSWSDRAAEMLRADMDAAREKWIKASKTGTERSEREQSAFLAYCDDAGASSTFTPYGTSTFRAWRPRAFIPRLPSTWPGTPTST